MSDSEEAEGSKRSSFSGDLKSTLVNMFDELKGDLMQHVETCVASATEEYYSPLYEESDDGSNVQLSHDIDNFLQSNTEPSTSQEKPAGQTDDFQNFVMEFSTSEKTGPPINDDLAKIVNSLLSDKLSKVKIDELGEKYSRL